MSTQFCPQLADRAVPTVERGPALLRLIAANGACETL
jgi:hypothetical protein